jgi:two-component system, OmpR family, phosphate regulon sensor histidine kinase PhoR
MHAVQPGSAHVASNPQQLEFTSFWRTFVLLILLVALPSAGLSGFGVLAIVNERASVEKRLELIWSGKLQTVGDELLARLRTANIVATEAGLEVRANDGALLSDGSFRTQGETVVAEDARVRAAVNSVSPVLAAVSERPVFFTVSTVQGPVLLTARRDGDSVKGARIPLDRLSPSVTSLAEKHLNNEPVKFELQPVKQDEGDGQGGLVSPKSWPRRRTRWARGRSRCR